MATAQLQMTVRQWATIDSEMDNSAYLIRERAMSQGEVSEYDMARLGELALDEQPRAIREAGAAQIPWTEPGKEWPPDEYVVSIELTDIQWEFVVRQLDRSVPVYQALGNTDGVRLLQDALGAIRANQ